MKVALVTGAASGIGHALAIAYAHAGVAMVGGYLPRDPHEASYVTGQALIVDGGLTVRWPS